MKKAVAAALLASPASALVIGAGAGVAAPPTVAHARTLSPEMGAWDRWGTGRQTPVPLGGVNAWGNPGDEQVTSTPAASARPLTKGPEAAWDAFGTGRMAPVPLGGVNAWEAPGQEASAAPALPPTSAPIPRARPAATSQPMSNPQASWDAFGTGRMTPVPLGGVKAWEPTGEKPAATAANEGGNRWYGTGRVGAVPLGGVNPSL